MTARRVRQAPLARPARQVLPGLLVRSVRLVRLVLLVRRVPQVPRELMELLVLQVQRAPPE